MSFFLGLTPSGQLVDWLDQIFIGRTVANVTFISRVKALPLKCLPGLIHFLGKWEGHSIRNSIKYE